MEYYVEEFWRAVPVIVMIFSPLIFYKEVRNLTRFDGMYVKEGQERLLKKSVFFLVSLVILGVISYALVEIS